jgi:hypothetical protein
MRTYIIDGMTILIGAQVLAVHHRGKTITPKEKKVGLIKRITKEYWRNNYFRRHTKTYLSVKAAEMVSRCMGAHGLYLIAREYIWPHAETIVTFIMMLDWWDIFFHFDVGFIIGVLTTMIGIYCKKKTYEVILQERGARA